MAIDPVCLMEVEESTAQWTSEYQGQTYYFCAPGCKASFDEDPEKYLSGDGAEKSHSAGDHSMHEGHSHAEEVQSGHDHAASSSDAGDHAMHDGHSHTADDHSSDDHN